jgi:hypothetical protein
MEGASEDSTKQLVINPTHQLLLGNEYQRI